MKQLSVTEFERIPRRTLGTELCARLQRFDDHFAKSSRETVFDWSRIGYIRALHWVGVIQVPGLQIEILPKTDAQEGTARKNLLLMMAACRRLPLRERDIAGLALEKRPILEALIAVFAERLLNELRRGLDHEYVRREENSGFVRGKIVLPIHLRKNLAHAERVYVAYDEFLEDTLISQILKRASRVLLRQTRVAETQRLLREALLVLANVSVRPIRPRHFREVRLSRQNERFRDLLDFCRLVLLENTPAPRAGETPTFSLLVQMNELFEEFVARMIRRHAVDLGLERSSVHIQGKRRHRHLVRDEDGRLRYRLKPDVLITDGKQNAAAILDTKWKVLGDEGDLRPSEADVYQLHAYAHRYRCPDNVLLFPSAPGLERRTFTFADADPPARLRVEFLDVSQDLSKDRSALVSQLREVLRGP